VTGDVTREHRIVAIGGVAALPEAREDLRRLGDQRDGLRATAPWSS
jgi:hypothetical protein